MSDDWVEEWGRQHRDVLLRLANGTGCASGPARDALRKLPTLREAHQRWRDALNGEGKQHD